MMNEDWKEENNSGPDGIGSDREENEFLNETAPEAPVTPEEEAEKAIRQAKEVTAEAEAAEEARRAAEREEAYRRAQEAQWDEQLARAEAIRRENKAREEAEKAAKAEKTAHRKKGLRITAAVLAVMLVVSAAGYAAGNIAKTIAGLKAQVTSLEDAQNSENRNAGQTKPDRRVGEGTEKESSAAAATDQAESATKRQSEGTPVVGTAPAAENAVVLTDVSGIVESVLPSVVSIVVTETVTVGSYWGGNRQYEQPGAGSGIIIGDNGSELWIVTNNHVVGDADTISVVFCDEESVDAYVKGTDKDNDLAVIGVSMENMKDSTLETVKAVLIGDSDDLKLGQGVIAIGNALGWGQSVTTGVVSALNREVEFEDGTRMYLLQTSAAINPGNSGGALLNAKGELVGINNSKYSDTDVEGVGFAIPISSVKEIMAELSLMQPRQAVSEEDYPYIGVTFKNLSSGYMEAYGIPSGAYIYEVGTGTPAEEAGLLAYDIITGLNGVKISSYDDLVEELQYYSGGTEVELTVMRLDRGRYGEVKVDLTLGYRKDFQR